MKRITKSSRHPIFKGCLRSAIIAVFCALMIMSLKVNAGPENIHAEFMPGIQSVVEKTINETVQQFHAEGGWAIVQDVKTGRILAMASHTNNLANAVNTTYDPGSIMKAITVAAALNERLVKPDTMLDAGNGVWVHEGDTLKDHVTGIMSVSNAIYKSSNIILSKIGLMLGAKRQSAYLRGFGFGSKLDCGLSDEEAGSVFADKDWTAYSLSRVPIGQCIPVTALQMVNAYSCIANGGKLMRPYFMRDGKPEVIGRPVRPEVAKVMRDMLRYADDDDMLLRSLGEISGAGKTGTAQKVNDGAYSDTEVYATSVGFFPADNPLYSVIVTIYAPKPKRTGGVVAFPAAAKIATAAKPLFSTVEKK